MRSLTLPLAAAALITLAGGATAPSALASDADFKLKNRTGYQIDEVYVSRHSADTWGHDIMGRDALADGEAVSITFPHGGEACHFDIKVKYHDDNSTAEWTDVNLCQYEAISLFWDAKDQVTKALGE